MAEDIILFVFSFNKMHIIFETNLGIITPFKMFSFLRVLHIENESVVAENGLFHYQVNLLPALSFKPFKCWNKSFLVT